jgi:hypothetical protein
VLIVSLFLEDPLYYSYIYFFSAGIVTLSIERSGWGQLCDTGLEIRFGIFNLVKIVIHWSEIEKITTAVKSGDKFLVDAAITSDKGREAQYIAIIFRSSIPGNIKKTIKKYGLLTLYGQSIDIIENDTILLNTPPACGPSEFCRKITDYARIEIVGVADNENDEKLNYNLSLYDLVLFLFPLILFALNYNKSITTGW